MQNCCSRRLALTAWIVIGFLCNHSAVGLGTQPSIGAAGILASAGDKPDTGIEAAPGRQLTTGDTKAPKDASFPAGYVALCLVVKDQAADLEEWLQYHQYIGVGRVYLYDNNSTKPLRHAVKAHLRSGFVKYMFFGVGRTHNRAHGFATTPQWQAYNDCIQRHRHLHRFLGFIDADEFVVLYNSSSSSSSRSSSSSSSSPSAAPQPAAHTKPDLPAILAQFEQFGGLGLNWVMFGSSGYLTRPKGGVLVNYHQCTPLHNPVHTHVKVFVNTAHVRTMGGNPHEAVYLSPDVFTVNEVGHKVIGPFSSPPSHTRASLYHYATKSKREFLQKMKRGAGDGTRKK